MTLDELDKKRLDQKNDIESLNSIYVDQSKEELLATFHMDDNYMNSFYSILEDIIQGEMLKTPYPKIQTRYDELSFFLKGKGISIIDFFNTHYNKSSKSIVSKNKKNITSRTIAFELEEKGVSKKDTVLLIGHIRRFYMSVLELLVTIRFQDKHKIASHRAMGYWEQLSYEAIDNAMQLWVKSIEIDIVPTKDSELVVSHDWKTVMNEKWIKRIKDFSFEEITDDWGLIDNTRWKIYKFENLFHLLKKYPKTAWLTVEIKAPWCVKPLLLLLKKYPECHKQLIITWFDASELLKIHSEYPNIPKSYNTAITKNNAQTLFNQSPHKKEWYKFPWFEIYFWGNTLPSSKKYTLFCQHTELPKKVITMLKESKGRLNVWTYSWLLNAWVSWLGLKTLLSEKAMKKLKVDAEKNWIKLNNYESQLKEVKNRLKDNDRFYVNEPILTRRDSLTA